MRWLAGFQTHLRDQPGEGARVVKGKRDPLFSYRKKLGNDARASLAPLFEVQHPQAWELMEQQFAVTHDNPRSHLWELYTDVGGSVAYNDGKPNNVDANMAAALEKGTITSTVVPSHAS